LTSSGFSARGLAGSTTGGAATVAGAGVGAGAGVATGETVGSSPISCVTIGGNETALGVAVFGTNGAERTDGEISPTKSGLAGVGDGADVGAD